MGKNMIVGQSGGPTAVINSSLYGVVAAGFASDGVDKVYGMIHGVQGFLQGEYMDFQSMKEDGTLENLKITPGAFLGSCRYMLPAELDDPVYPEIIRRLEELNIGCFFYCGGNDSMDTVSKLSRYGAEHGCDIRFIGIPKTIDNDLVLTDHTPGYGSAARYVAQSVRETVYDASVYAARSVTVVEIMGRDTGWLTAAGILAREPGRRNPCMICLPEVDFDLEDFLKKIEEHLKKQNALVVCVSEGIHDASGKLLCEYESATGLDAFGHKMLSGSGAFVTKMIKERLGVKTRFIELSTLQRCSQALMSLTDRQEAAEAGRIGVQAALKGATGVMVAFEREAAEPYRINCVLKDVNLICNQVKKVPREWISEDGYDLTDEFVQYAKPLIQGVAAAPMGEDGLPAFVKR